MRPRGNDCILIGGVTELSERSVVTSLSYHLHFVS